MPADWYKNLLFLSWTSSWPGMRRSLWVVTRPSSDVLIIAPHFLRNFITDISGNLAGWVYLYQGVMLYQISWKLFPSRHGRDWPNIIGVVVRVRRWVGGLHHSATGGNYSFLTSQLENIQTTNTDTAPIFPHQTRARGSLRTGNISASTVRRVVTQWFDCQTYIQFSRITTIIRY